MNIFVTGATGFVGRYFLPALLARLGPADRVLSLQRRATATTDERVTVLLGDLRDLAAHAAALRSASWIFHLAADATFGQGAHYEAHNVAPVRRMIEILRPAPRFERFVLVSTIGAMDRAPGDRVRQPLTPATPPHPASDYGRSKLAAETLLRESGLPFTILRPAWVYGTGMRSRSHLRAIASLVARHPWFARLDFPGRVPLIHARDLAASLVRCLDAPASRDQFYIAVTENRSLGEIASLLHHAIHRRSPGWRLRWPRLRLVLGRVHARLPLALNNLSLDYLAAEDPAFHRELLPNAPLRLETGVGDLAAPHSPAGRWWIVTGANSGIGLALIRQLLSDGTSVLAVDRETHRLAPAPALEIVPLDLTEAEAIAQFAARIASRPLAGLINNAGVGFRGGLFEQTWSQAERTVQVNILGSLRLTHALKEQLVRDGTTIVNIASSVAYHPLPGMSVYAASKAFIRSWSLALSRELRATNRVVTFSPSGTRTAFQTSAGVRGAGQGDLLPPEFVAGGILADARRGRRHRLLGLKSQVLVTGSHLLPLPLRLWLWDRLFAVNR